MATSCGGICLIKRNKAKDHWGIPRGLVPLFCCGEVSAMENGESFGYGHAFAMYGM